MSSILDALKKVEKAKTKSSSLVELPFDTEETLKQAVQQPDQRSKKKLIIGGVGVFVMMLMFFFYFVIGGQTDDKQKQSVKKSLSQHQTSSKETNNNTEKMKQSRAVKDIDSLKTAPVKNNPDASSNSVSDAEKVDLNDIRLDKEAVEPTGSMADTSIETIDVDASGYDAAEVDTEYVDTSNPAELKTPAEDDEILISASDSFPQQTSEDQPAEEEIPPETLEPASPSKYKLHAISWSAEPNQRIAVINGVLVHEGKKLEGDTVERIEKDYVVLHDGSERKKLGF